MIRDNHQNTPNFSLPCPMFGLWFCSIFAIQILFWIESVANLLLKMLELLLVLAGKVPYAKLPKCAFLQQAVNCSKQQAIIPACNGKSDNPWGLSIVIFSRIMGWDGCSSLALTNLQKMEDFCRQRTAWTLSNCLHAQAVLITLQFFLSCMPMETSMHELDMLGTSSSTSAPNTGIFVV